MESLQVYSIEAKTLTTKTFKKLDLMLALYIYLHIYVFLSKRRLMIMWLTIFFYSFEIKDFVQKASNKTIKRKKNEEELI